MVTICNIVAPHAYQRHAARGLKERSDAVHTFMRYDSIYLSVSRVCRGIQVVHRSDEAVVAVTVKDFLHQVRYMGVKAGAQ
jgi:hypothetical protein